MADHAASGDGTAAAHLQFDEHASGAERASESRSPALHVERQPGNQTGACTALRPVRYLGCSLVTARANPTSSACYLQLMNSNPEMAHILNNPQLLRESLNLAANPSLLREQMRHSDRAMSNLEAHPEGFNALRRMYENIQVPQTSLL